LAEQSKAVTWGLSCNRSVEKRVTDRVHPSKAIHHIRQLVSVSLASRSKNCVIQDVLGSLR
jgi:hypothetical protein